MKGRKGECLQEFYLLSEEITLAITRGNFSAGFSDSIKNFWYKKWLKHLGRLI